MKTIGILGGMGPAATADLFQKIIQSTHAMSDSEQPRVLIDSNTSIPDRTAAIMEGSSAPLCELVRSALLLERMGADFLVMACNTAHHYYSDMLPFLRVPFVSMVHETVAHLIEKGVESVGLLATDGVHRSGVYEKELTYAGIKTVRPDEGWQQQAVMDMIYNCVKTGNKEKYDMVGFLEMLFLLRRQGVQKLILGCTELPIAFEWFGIEADTVDPTLLLARKAVEMAGCIVKPM